jgi:hypothetical protein
MRLAMAPGMRHFAIALVLAGCSDDPSSVFDSGGSRWEYDAGFIDDSPYRSDVSSPFDGSFLQPGPHPDFGTTVSLADPPPPVSGGTLAVSPDGRWAVAADPDRDNVYVIDLAPTVAESATFDRDPVLAFTIALSAHDEPGRVVIDGSNRAHVALRGGGSLVTIDLVTHETTKRAVCAAPRGIAWDAITDAVHVACATGELVTFPAAGGAATRTVMIERDLRDVVIAASKLWVSTFKTAQLLQIDDVGKVAKRVTPSIMNGPTFEGGSSQVKPFGAWRTIAVGNDIWTLLQGSSGSLSINQGGYGGSVPCQRPLEIFLAITHGDGTPAISAKAIGDVAVVTDVAFAPKKGAVIPILGNAHTQELAHWAIFDPQNPPQSKQCNGSFPAAGFDPMQFTAAAATNALVLLQSREPAELLILEPYGNPIAHLPLSNVSREDTGHAIFHSNASVFIACASCHLEAGEDGITWQLNSVPRRTPSLRGTIKGTAPYHWDGAMTDISKLLADVYSIRMNGGPLDITKQAVVKKWIESLPAPPAVSGDAALRALGQQLFIGKGGCTGCHSGSKFTDNAGHNVGNSFAFQTPSLVGVGWRAPFLHDGCAKTLADRFSVACRGPSHGNWLTPDETTEIVAYLDSL